MKGLDELARQMDAVSKAVADLDGEVVVSAFDPHDPQSIELAIQRMEAAIDERVGDYGRDDAVEGIVDGMKERYRQAIVERAALGRSEGKPRS